MFQFPAVAANGIMSYSLLGGHVSCVPRCTPYKLMIVCPLLLCHPHLIAISTARGKFVIRDIERVWLSLGCAVVLRLSVRLHDSWSRSPSMGVMLRHGILALKGKIEYRGLSDSILRRLRKRVLRNCVVLSSRCGIVRLRIRHLCHGRILGRRLRLGRVRG